MHKCKNCNAIFDEPEVIHTTYESYYGVSDEFSSSTRMELYVCPYCESDDYESYCEEEDEYETY